MLTQTGIDTLEDGRVVPRYSYEEEPGKELMTNIPISGTVRLLDGTIYGLDPGAIEVRSEHVGPLLHHIEKAIQAAPPHPGLIGFAHVCSEMCGSEAAPAPEG